LTLTEDGLNSKDIIKMIEADGWQLIRTKGSHHHFKHPVKKGLVTIPHPKRTLPKGTVASILKLVGLK
jgi:predicted RNA binding protein YcfA (HicA-like mRNA interferase family)